MVSAANKVEEERLVLRRRAVFIVLCGLVPHPMIQEVLQGHTWVVSLEEFPLIVIRLSHVRPDSLEPSCGDLLVLRALFHFAWHVAAEHKVAFHGRLAGQLRLVAAIILVVLVHAVIRLDY